MTVPVGQKWRDDYAATAAQTVFAGTFKIYAEADLEVLVDGVTQIGGYTVTGVGDAAGFTVTFNTGLVVNQKVLLLGIRPVQQDVDIANNSKLPEEQIEAGFDKGVILTGQLAEKFGRAPKFAKASTFKDVDFPDLVALKVLRVNAAGTGLELVDNLTAGVYTNPITTQGDLLRGGAAGAVERVAVGASGKQLASDPATGKPEWHPSSVLGALNKTGGAHVVGDVVALDVSNDASVALSDVSASLKNFVVALLATANNGAGLYAYAGLVTGVKSTGAIARGQYIRKSATAKAIEDAGVAMNGTSTAPSGTIGVAVKAAAGGLVDVYLFGYTVVATAAPTDLVARFRGLRVFTDSETPTTKVRILTDDAMLVTSTGSQKRFQNPDVTADVAAAGAGGLDTGAKTNSTEYDLYLIGKDDGTVNGMWSKGFQWKKSVDITTGRDGAVALRDAAARTKIGLRFQIGDTGKLHSVDLSMLRVTTPAGIVWAELWSVAAGAPNALVAGGRGMVFPVDGMDSGNRVIMRCVFPSRPAVTTGTDYYVVLSGTYAIGAAHVTFGVDTTSPAIPSAAVASYDGAAWAVDTTRGAAEFTANVLTGSEIPYSNLPVGYTFAGRVSCAIVDSSGNFPRLAQEDDDVVLYNQAEVAAPTPALTWQKTDLSASIPGGWTKAVCVGWGGDTGQFMKIASPLPLDDGSLSVSEQPPYAHQLVAAGTLDVVIPGWVGPMFWTVVNNTGGYIVRGYKVRL